MTGGVIVVAVCFLCLGCLMALPVMADKPVEKADLSGTEWNLESYLNSTGGMVSELKGTDITLEFGEDGRLGGSGGCNNYFASYELDGEKLTVGPAGSTMMAGPEDVMAQESAFLGLLGSVAGYQIEGDRLTLTDADGREILVFSEAVPPADRLLTGTNWVLDSYNNGNEAVVSVISGTEITAVFDEDGRVAGSAGCNNYFASYELDGEKLSVGMPGSTRMIAAEPKGIMEQESTFLSVLESVAGYEIDGNSLTLQNSSGETVLTFSAEE